MQVVIESCRVSKDHCVGVSRYLHKRHLVDSVQQIALEIQIFLLRQQPDHGMRHVNLYHQPKKIFILCIYMNS